MLRKRNKIVTFWILAPTLSLITASPAMAEYVPLISQEGKIVTVGVCLPKSAKSPVLLQTWYDDYSMKKTVATIKFSTLNTHHDCDFYSGMPGHGRYRLTYKWKINVTGEQYLSFRVPNLGTDLEGWPDGVISKPKIGSSPMTNPDDLILNQDASKFLIPGSALITLQQVWGVSLSGVAGPKSFRQVADEIYLSLNRQVGRKVTQQDLEISFQNGNSMQSFFSRLIENVFAYQAMKNRLIYNSNQP